MMRYLTKLWSWPAAITAVVAVAWLAAAAAWLWLRQPANDAAAIAQHVVFTLAAVTAVAWVVAGYRRGGVWRYGIWSLAYLPLWQVSVFWTDALELHGLRVWLAQAGLFTLFAVGLLWMVWGMERAARYYQRQRFEAQAAIETSAVTSPLPLRASAAMSAAAVTAPRQRIWNPLDLNAWYYGEQSPRLRQSTAGLCSYTLAFCLTVFLFSQIGGCQEIYEMPAGGGEQQQLAQQVQVQKVIRRKYVINPASVVVFNPPPIDDVKLQLMELTQHAYKVGYGQGDGAGFAGGTSRGKVRFIRLEYAGGDWNQDFGIGADLNMLIEYGARTGQPVAERTESRTIAQLANFKEGNSPPLVYLTGQRNITLSKSEVAILRDYLLTKHGMLFGDNGGSSHFHNQFFAMMRQVLPQVEPVRVPLDDPIHSVPYRIPFLPYAAPHGGKDAWGWKVDGRWVCYYHPGDIGDAWTDDHAGVRPEVWEGCYQLGTNIIFYAHVEYSKWLEARAKK